MSINIGRKLPKKGHFRNFRHAIYSENQKRIHISQHVLLYRTTCKYDMSLLASIYDNLDKLKKYI